MCIKTAGEKGHIEKERAQRWGQQTNEFWIKRTERSLKISDHSIHNYLKRVVCGTVH